MPATSPWTTGTGAWAGDSTAPTPALRGMPPCRCPRAAQHAHPQETHRRGPRLELGARILQLLGGCVATRLGRPSLLLGCSCTLVLRGRLVLQLGRLRSKTPRSGCASSLLPRGSRWHHPAGARAAPGAHPGLLRAQLLREGSALPHRVGQLRIGSRQPLLGVLPPPATWRPARPGAATPAQAAAVGMGGHGKHRRPLDAAMTPAQFIAGKEHRMSSLRTCVSWSASAEDIWAFSAACALAVSASRSCSVRCSCSSAAMRLCASPAAPLAACSSPASCPCFSWASAAACFILACILAHLRARMPRSHCCTCSC